MENEYEEITLERNGQDPLIFRGKQIGFGSGRLPQTQHEFSSSRWTQATLFETKEGKYILYSEHISLWQDEPTRRETRTYDSLTGVFEGFRQEYGMLTGYMEEIERQIGLKESE